MNLLGQTPKDGQVCISALNYIHILIVCVGPSSPTVVFSAILTRLSVSLQGNGILHLGDALHFLAKADRPWSFQRGYIPIFMVCPASAIKLIY